MKLPLLLNSAPLSSRKPASVAGRCLTFCWGISLALAIGSTPCPTNGQTQGSVEGPSAAPDEEQGSDVAKVEAYRRPTLEEAAEIGELIKQLGSPKFADRTAAQQKLKKLLHIARLQLIKASQDPDAERAMRARVLLRQIYPTSHVILDAQGNPIAGAAVFVLSGGPGNQVRSRPHFSDAEGGIGVDPALAGPMTIEVRHSDFGIARVFQSLRGRRSQPQRLKFPVVPLGSQAWSRAVFGRVVDARDLPLPNVEVRCNSIRTLGAGLLNPEHPQGCVVTNRKGEFRLYAPVRSVNPNTILDKYIVPPHSSYLLHFTPKSDSEFPRAGYFVNGEPHRVTLPKTMKQRRDFRFLVDGRSKTPGQLKHVAVTYSAPKGGVPDPLNGAQDVALSGEDVLYGRRLIPGVYHATSYDNSGGAIRFEPLEVNDDSPAVLTFRSPNVVVFRGQVVDGVTGSPAPFAWVMGTNGSAYNNLAALSEADWKVLEQIKGPLKHDLTHPAFQLLSKFFGVKVITRADADGRFSLTQEPGLDFYFVTAFAKNKLPIGIRTSLLQQKNAAQGGVIKRGASQKDGAHDVGAMRLYPAASVMVQVDSKDRISVCPEWVFEGDDQPEWLGAFQDYDKGDLRDYHYVHWMKLNVPRPIFVPAGAQVRLKISAPYDQKWAPIVTHSAFRLKEGERATVNAPLKLKRSLTIDAIVVGPDGKPLEGIPVRRMHDSDGGWSVPHNTDANGRVQFFVFPETQGSVGIVDLKGPPQVAKAPNLKVRFDPAKTVEDLRIQLTQEQIASFR